MARLKKGVAKKPNVTKRASKKASPNKEAASLHQAFINSRAALETYWQKKSTQLKKQLDTLRVKHEKTVKQKSAKTSPQKIKQSADALAEIKEAFSVAKASASKYVALGKTITQFERDWAKKAVETTSKPEKTKAIKPAKKSATKPSKAKKGDKQKAQPVENWIEEIIEEEKEEKVVPFAKKERTKKKKGKEQAEPAMAAMPAEEIEDEMEEMISEDNEEFDAVAEELASDDLYLELDEEDLVSELRIIDDASSDLLEEEDPYEDYSS